MANFQSLYGPYTIDQQGTIRNKDRNVVPHRDGDVVWEDYKACLLRGINPTTVVVGFAETLQPLDQLRLKAVLDLRDRLDAFVRHFKQRFPEAEIASFSDKVAQAKSYLAEGLTEFSMPLKFEADMLKLTVPQTTIDTVVSDIMRNYEAQRVMIPFVSAIRQGAMARIEECLYVSQMTQVIDEVCANLPEQFAAYVASLNP